SLTWGCSHHYWGGGGVGAHGVKALKLEYSQIRDGIGVYPDYTSCLLESSEVERKLQQMSRASIRRRRWKRKKRRDSLHSLPWRQLTAEPHKSSSDLQTHRVVGKFLLEKKAWRRWDTMCMASNQALRMT
ncbi:unnamed protein product, partial [Caretta caretta]